MKYVVEVSQTDKFETCELTNLVIFEFYDDEEAMAMASAAMNHMKSGSVCIRLIKEDNHESNED